MLHGRGHSFPTRRSSDLQYPIQCFVGNGVERKMVRTYLKKRLPSSITGVVNRRGLQSADFVKRIEKQWEFSKSMFDDYLRNESLCTHI